MARKKTTIYVEDSLLKAAKIVAARTGKKEYEVVEEALRGYLGLVSLEKTWNRSKLTEKETLEIAHKELHAARK